MIKILLNASKINFKMILKTYYLKKFKLIIILLIMLKIIENKCKIDNQCTYK